jgi:hypothetical protein
MLGAILFGFGCAAVTAALIATVLWWNGLLGNPRRSMRAWKSYINEDDRSLPPFAPGEVVEPVSASLKWHAEQRGVETFTVSECFCSKSPQGPRNWWVYFEEIPSSYLATEVRATKGTIS